MKVADTVPEPPLPFSYVTRELCRQALKLALAVCFAAYLLHACKSVLGNVPVAIALVALAQWHLRASRPAGAQRAPARPQQPLALDLLQSALSVAGHVWLLLHYTLGCILSGDSDIVWRPSSLNKGPLVIHGNSTPPAGVGGDPRRPQQQRRETYPQSHGNPDSLRYAGASTAAAAAAVPGSQQPGRQQHDLQHHHHHHHQGQGTPTTKHRHSHSQQQGVLEELAGTDGKLGHSASASGPSGLAAVSHMSFDGPDMLLHSAAHDTMSFSLHRLKQVATGASASSTATGPEGGGHGGRAGVGRVERDGWQAQVGSPVVEFAWEKLSGAIVQTWVYDTWWALLSPDREFPAEVRRLLHAAFGQLAARARKLDVAGVLFRDVCEALIACLESYRAALEHLGGEEALEARALKHAAQNLAMAPAAVATTAAASSAHGREGGAGGRPLGAAAAMAVSAAREKLLQGGLRECGALHPAFEEPDGHYLALRDIADALVGVLWSGDDMLCGRLRPLLRELLCSCLLRPVLMLASPHTVNRVLAATLPPLPEECSVTTGAAASGTGSSSGQGAGLAAAASAAAAASTAASAAGGVAPSTAQQNRRVSDNDVGDSTFSKSDANRSTHGSGGRGSSSTDRTDADHVGNSSRGRPASQGPPNPRSLSAQRLAVSTAQPPTGSSGSGAASGGGTSSVKSTTGAAAAQATRSAAAGGAAAAATAADAGHSADATARAAAECSLEFERRVAANAAAERALMQKLVSRRSNSGALDGNRRAEPLHQRLSGPAAAGPAAATAAAAASAASSSSTSSRSGRRRGAAPSLQPRPADPAPAGGVPQQALASRPHPHQAPPPPHGHRRQPSGGSPLPHPSAASTSVAAAAPGGSSALVRKSASSTDLHSLGGAAADSGATSGDGGPAAAAAGAATAAGAGASPSAHAAAAPPPPQPRGLSTSYHAGMNHPQGPPHPHLHSHQLRDHGGMPGGEGDPAAAGQWASAAGGLRHRRSAAETRDSSAGASPEALLRVAPSSALPGGAVAGGDASRASKHRRSCSYDTAGARSGGGGGAGEGPAGESGGGGGKNWFDFDFGGGLTMPWQKAGAEPLAAPRPPRTASSSSSSSGQQRHHDVPYKPEQQQSQQAQTASRQPAPPQPPPPPSPPPPPVAAAAAAVASDRAAASAKGASAGGSGGSWCRASVAAYEMVSEPLKIGLTAEYVVYNIRVADAATGAEWTVARRFRSFEAMAAKLAAAHPRLKSLILALPPKRIFFHASDVAFVNSRRAELDAYLQQLLAHPELAESPALKEFLLPDPGAAPVPAAAAVDSGTTGSWDSGPARSSPGSAATGSGAGGGGGGGGASAARNLLERVAVDLRGKLGSASGRQKTSEQRAGGQQQQSPASGGSGSGSRAFAWLSRRDGDGTAATAVTAAAAAAASAPPLVAAASPGKERDGGSGTRASSAGMGSDDFDDLEADEGGAVVLGAEDRPPSRASPGTTNTRSRPHAASGAETGPSQSAPAAAAAQPSSSFRFGLPAWAGGGGGGGGGTGGGTGGGGGSFVFASVRNKLRQETQPPPPGGGGGSAAAETAANPLVGTAAAAATAAATATAVGAASAAARSGAASPEPSNSPSRPVSGGSGAAGPGPLSAGAARLMAALRCAATAATAGSSASPGGGSGPSAAADSTARPLPLTPAASEDPPAASAAANCYTGSAPAAPGRSPPLSAAAGGGYTPSSHPPPRPLTGGGTASPSTAASRKQGLAAGAAAAATAAEADAGLPLPLRPSIDAPQGGSPAVRHPSGAATAGPSRPGAAAAAASSAAAIHGPSQERQAKPDPFAMTAAAAGAAARVASVPNSPIAAQPAAGPPTPPRPLGCAAEPPPSSVPPAAAVVAGQESTAATGGAGGGAAAGISAPLYELVDVLFGLQGQGFFRRQVISVTRQTLSFLAGDYIDTFISQRLRHLTSEHSLARALLMLHGALFPGGAWYSFGQPPPQQPPQRPDPPQQHHQQTPHTQHPQRPPQQHGGSQHHHHGRSASGGGGGGGGASVGAASGPPPRAPPSVPAAPRWRPNPPLRAEGYLEQAAPPPDGEQLAERVRSRLFSRPPAVLVNLVGARGYSRVLRDVWGLMQSRTMVLQLAYSLLITLLARMFPELEQQLAHLKPPGAAGAAGGGAGAGTGTGTWVGACGTASRRGSAGSRGAASSGAARAVSEAP